MTLTDTVREVISNSVGAPLRFEGRVAIRKVCDRKDLLEKAVHDASIALIQGDPDRAQKILTEVV